MILSVEKANKSRSLSFNPYILGALFIMGIFFKAFLGTHLILYVLLIYVFYSSIVKNNLRINMGAEASKILFLILIYGFILLLRDLNAYSFRAFIVQSISLSMLVLLLKCKMDVSGLKKMTKILRVAFGFFLILFAFQYLRGQVTGGGNTFAFGIYQMIYALSIFLLYDNSKRIIYCILASAICLMSGDRGDGITIMVVLISYFILDRIRKSKKLFYLFFWIVAAVSSGYSFLFIWLAYSPYSTAVNAFVIKYTHANLFSGRHTIWLKAKTLIMQHPIIGNGFSTMAYTLNDSDLLMSAHNTYVQILVTGGIILMVLFLLLLFSIWKQYFKFLKYESVRVSAAALIGAMVISTNIVVMVGTDIQTSIYMYFGITMGIMVKNSENDLIQKIVRNNSG